MDPDRWTHVDELLQSALDLPRRSATGFFAAPATETHGSKTSFARYSPHTTVPTGSSALRRSISPHASSPESAATTAVRPAAIR